MIHGYVWGERRIRDCVILIEETLRENLVKSVHSECRSNAFCSNAMLVLCRNIQREVRCCGRARVLWLHACRLSTISKRIFTTDAEDDAVITKRHIFCHMGK